MSADTTQSSSVEPTPVIQNSCASSPAASSKSALSWSEMADRVLAGESLSHCDALAILSAPEDEVLAILDAAFRVRKTHFGK